MNFRFFHATAKRFGACAGFGFVLAAFLLFANRGHAQEQAVAAPAADLPVFSSPELDALVAKLAVQITKNKLKTIVVVGVPGPERRVTELGVSVRNALSDSLARRAHDVKVIDSDSIRAFLRQSRVAEDMMYSDALREWITGHMNADGFVTAHLGIPANGRVFVSAEISIMRKGVFVREPRIESEFTLTESQMQAADADFHPRLKIAAVQQDTARVTRPQCISCPNPEYSEEARKLKIPGAASLLVTVRTDGVTDDILITIPAGYGLDVQAVNAVLSWKFKPGTNAQGQPIAVQIPIEITFNFK